MEEAVDTAVDRAVDRAVDTAVGGAALTRRVTDLRSAAAVGPLTLRFPAGHRVVVTGLPGSGKSTLMRRAAAGDGTPLLRLDSQDVREDFARRLPRWLPYAAYHPAVRITHYARLWRALRAPTRVGVIVHDAGRTAWVRRWLGRRGRVFHLVVLDVAESTALAGQEARGRAVRRVAFARYRRSLARLVGELEAGRLPPRCASAVLLDRPAAEAVRSLLIG